MQHLDEAAIDVHAHAVPETVLRLIERDGRRFGGIELDRSGGKPVITFPGEKPLRPLPNGMSDGTSRRSWMDEQGVAAQIVSPWMDIQGNAMDAAAGKSWVTALNDAMVEGLESLDADARMLASVYPSDPDASVAEMLRARDDLGSCGVMLATHFGDASASDAAMRPFWEAAAAERIPIVLHPPIVGPASAIPGSEEFRSLYGRTLETTFVATRLVLDGVLEDLPDLRVVLVHGGGYLPYQAGRMDQQVQSGKVRSALGDRMPSEFVERFYYDTAMLAPPAVGFLNSVAPGRVMVGSDGPFTYGSVDVKGWLAAVPGADRDQVAHATADIVFASMHAETAHAH